MAEKSPLGYLVSAYLNEDVFDFYPDVLAGVDDFVHSDPHLAGPLDAEISDILASRSDGEIDDLLVSLGIGFIPGELGYRGWLIRIADRVRSAAST